MSGNDRDTVDHGSDAPVILAPDDSLERAIEALRAGGVVAYPTETFYALGVDAYNERAVKRLYSLKGRPTTDPVSIIVANVGMLGDAVEEVTSSAETLIKKFWPGPLTIIFRSTEKARHLSGNTGTIGARMTPHPVARRLVKEFGSPLTATSANPRGQRSAVQLADVLNYFPGLVDVAIDAGLTHGKLGSTIVDTSTGGVKLVRKGDLHTNNL